MRLSFKLITIYLLASLLMACTKSPSAADADKKPTRKTTMTNNTPWIEPEIFASITTNEEGQTPCTPEKPNIRNWEGIIINAPKVARARAGQKFFIPVCLYGMIPGTYPEEPETLIVAKNIRTNKIHKGLAYIPPVHDELIARDPMPPQPKTKLSAEEIQAILATASRARFTSDLFSNAKLPPESAIYKVHIEHGNLKSNEVTIEVVWEK